MPSRIPLAAVVAALIVVLVAVVGSSGPVRVWTAPAPSREAAPSAPLDVAGRDAGRGDPGAVPWTTPEPSRAFAIIGDVISVLALGALAVVTVLLVRRAVRAMSRLVAALRRPDPEQVPFGAPVDPLDVTPVRLRPMLEHALRAEVPPRNAIVACWLQLEEDVAASGLARETWETSVEYSTRVVAAGSVDRGPIEALAALYREARFSEHLMGEEHRRAAADALGRVRASLEPAAVAP